MEDFKKENNFKMLLEIANEEHMIPLLNDGSTHIQHFMNKVNSFIEAEIIGEKKQITEEINKKGLSINVGDRCRIKKKDVLFEDKMTTKYSKTIYTIIKVNKNSVEINHNNDNLTVKKTEIMIVRDNVEHIAPDTHQKAVQIQARQNNKNARAQVDVNNIIQSPRERKKKVIFDL